MEGEVATRENIGRLVEGRLASEEIRKLMRLRPKDADRFWKYLDVLQARVPWKDKILIRISDHLYVVLKKDGGRVVKCDCGQEFGDYRVNWKFSSRIRVRRTHEELAEVITVDEAVPNVNLVEMREFYCPGCLSQLAVEVVPVGYPVTFEVLPDLDAYYREWLGKPLEDERADWYKDRTAELISHWTKEG